MAAKKTAVPDPSLDEEVKITLTGDVYLEEWNMTLHAGQDLTVKRSLLEDDRLKGKFEEI